MEQFKMMGQEKNLIRVAYYQKKSRSGGFF